MNQVWRNDDKLVTEWVCVKVYENKSIHEKEDSAADNSSTHSWVEW